MEKFDAIDNRRTDPGSVAMGALRHGGALLLGAVFTASVGMLIYNDSAFQPRERALTPALSQSAVTSVTAAEKRVPMLRGAYLAASVVQAAGAEPAPVFVVVDTKKAMLGEYDRTQSVEKSQDSDVLDPEDFTVPMPEDKTVVYIPVKGDPQGLTDTRDTSGEWYTVYDENSGSHVTLPAFEIVCQIVNNEIGDSWGTEAIKAQAVAAYSYVRFGYSIGIIPSVGLKPGYSSKLESCVRSVEGQAMYYDGSVINAVYSASTAGYSTCSKDIWGADRPYLRCVESEYDSKDPNWDYEKTYTREEVRKILEERFDITMSEDVTRWFTVNRVYSVRYVDSFTINGDPNAKISGNGLCNLFGLKSNAIEISYKSGVFTFKSCGWGHGVGLSQWGTKYYADAGWTYDQILRHYYVNANLALSGVDTKAGAKAVEDEEKPQEEQQETVTTTLTTAPEVELPDTQLPQEDTGWTETTTTSAPEVEIPQEDTGWTETQYTEPEPAWTEQSDYTQDYTPQDTENNGETW